MTDRWNNYGSTPDDLPAAYDASASDRASDAYRDGYVGSDDPLWEIEKQKARDFAARWLPTIRMTRRQAQ